MIFHKKWGIKYIWSLEIFYTEANEPDGSLSNGGRVDIIYIEAERERYVLDRHIPEMNTDGYYEDATEVVSHYISKTLFEIMVEAIQNKGFRKLVELEE